MKTYAPKMAVYLHAGEGPPDFVTENRMTITEVAQAFGWHPSQLVMANALAEYLDSPITGQLADEEEPSMVRVVMKGTPPSVGRRS